MSGGNKGALSNVRALAAAVALLAGGSLAAVAAPASAQALTFVETWSKVLPDKGHPIGLSSPNIATLGGQPAVVVGDRAGYVYALDLANGQPVEGWPASTGGIPVDSTPSVAAVGSGSSDDTVFVGVGNSATPTEGGYEAFSPDGLKRWYVPVKNPASDHAAGATSAVIASLAVGDLQNGTPDVVAPSVGQEEYAINAATGTTLPGFPWFSADSGFSTPALADVYANGQLDIVEGGDQTAGLAFGVQYSQGGHIRVLSPQGNAGSNSPAAGLDCESNPDQAVESSPAVGPFLSGGAVGIVVGTSHYWAGASDTDKVLAFDPRCQLAWQATLDGTTESSPALADINGSLSVIEGTNAGRGHGSVYALAGATGAVLWQTEVGQVIGGVVTADLGAGYQDVLVPTTAGAVVLDGRNGQVLATLEHGVGLQSSPLVTNDPNGTIGVTVAGYNGYNEGDIEHFQLTGSVGGNVDQSGAWPMFHHDPQLSGNAGVPLAADPPAPKPGQSVCEAPLGGPNGYYELGADGHVWSFGNLAFCGSALSHGRLGPMAGIAATPDGGGYWVAGSAGGLWAYGDAKIYKLAHGSPRPKPANLVAVDAAPDGHGYWLVSRSGQVWAYGDAKLYKAQPHTHVKGKVTGFALTGDAHGYWLVASNGTVYGFGDATARPSPAHMGTVVGIAPDTATGGYWLVNSRGQVYAIGGAFFYGSVPLVANEHAVSGIVAEPGGAGYRLVDNGGALFCYGIATELGSVFGTHPARPVIAIAAPGAV